MITTNPDTLKLITGLDELFAIVPRDYSFHDTEFESIHWQNGDEDAAWELLMDDPKEGKYWRAKFAFLIQKKPIEDATAQAGITIDEYMRFFHPDRME